MWIYIAISTFLGFCGFLDSAHQPSRAWQNAHKSKFLWVLINFVGMISLFGGAVTFLLYSYGGTRRAVVRKGGYNRRREMNIRKTAAPIIDEMNMREGRNRGD
jgi:hypothetical protein